MSDDIERKADGTFKGSGNPKGRPPGAKNKAMTTKAAAEYIRKRTEAVYDEIFSIIQDSSTESTVLRAAGLWLAEDKALQKELREEYKHKMDIKKAEQEEKESVPASTKPENKSKVIDLKNFK